MGRNPDRINLGAWVLRRNMDRIDFAVETLNARGVQSKELAPYTRSSFLREALAVKLAEVERQYRYTADEAVAFRRGAS